jgi:hypothetical protein
LPNWRSYPSTVVQRDNSNLLKGKNIQLVAALIIRLIQTRDTYRHRKKKYRLQSTEMKKTSPRKNRTSTMMSKDQRKLYHLCSLLDDAQQTSTSIVSYLVSKPEYEYYEDRGQPYRHLLDISTEDFLAVLGSPKRPAPELPLCSLARSMQNIIDETTACH